jgi:hypothetical protein
VRRIDGNTVTLYSVITDQEHDVEVDTVVFACGGEADNAVYRALQERFGDREGAPELKLIGDALAPRRLLYATRDGNRVGKEI